MLSFRPGVWAGTTPENPFGRTVRQKVGFYKRGCQEKTLLSPQEGKQISDIPLPPSGCNTIQGLSPNFSLHVAGRSRRHSGTYKQRGRFWATMVLSETRGLSLHWVVRGGIRSLGRLKA